MGESRKINCRVHSVADGSKLLVFEVAGASECIGEMRLAVADARYLPVISQLFANWVGGERARPVLSLVDRGVTHGINGKHHP